MQPLAPVLLGPQPEQSFDLDRPLREARDAFEKSYFEFHLAQENGSMTRVAEKTGLERTHLYASSSNSASICRATSAARPDVDVLRFLVREEGRRYNRRLTAK